MKKRRRVAGKRTATSVPGGCAQQTLAAAATAAATAKNGNQDQHEADKIDDGENSKEDVRISTSGTEKQCDDLPPATATKGTATPPQGMHHGCDDDPCRLCESTRRVLRVARAHQSVPHDERSCEACHMWSMVTARYAHLRRSAVGAAADRGMDSSRVEVVEDDNKGWPFI